MLFFRATLPHSIRALRSQNPPSICGAVADFCPAAVSGDGVCALFSQERGWVAQILRIRAAGSQLDIPSCFPDAGVLGLGGETLARTLARTVLKIVHLHEF